MPIQPVLNFDGRCEEALLFYQEALDAQLQWIRRHRDNAGLPGAVVLPALADKITHAAFRLGDTTFLASDGHCRGQPRFRGVSLGFVCEEEAEARRRFAALAEHGSIQVPLGRSHFAPLFGVVVDRFGVSWIILVAA